MRCDCGYDFESGEMRQSFLSETQLIKEPSILHPLTTADILICVLLPGIGFILGLVRLISRRPGAVKMLGLSSLFIMAIILVKTLITRS